MKSGEERSPKPVDLDDAYKAIAKVIHQRNEAREENEKLARDNERLRTDLASAEEALRQVDAELTALAEENDRLRARVAELEEQVKEAVVRLARVPNMLDRERREGAEAMRERVANVARSFGFDVVADEIRALPLDDDAREDAQGDDNGR